MKNIKVTDFIGHTVSYDKHGQYLWGTTEKDGMQMVGEIRGWGAIQHLFKNPDGSIDLSAAGKFQDELGEWIADAINQKLKSETI
jgi:hypothetical protein